MEPNWAAVLDEIFREVDGDEGGPFYYSGPVFLQRMKFVKADSPDYPTLIAQRNAEGKSTTRRDYFRDLFFALNEEERFKFTIVVVMDLQGRGHKRWDEMFTLLGDGVMEPDAVKIPEGLWNAGRLNEFLGKIDSALEANDPERVLTLCYTCMEGFFKAYVLQNVPTKWGENEIVALSRIVKDDLRNKNSSYPAEVFNVVTQTAHALNRIRDAFSESHFGGQASKWVATYARDLVHTHVRLILNFM